MNFFTPKTKKIPRAAKRSLLPREEFVAHGKERFLAAFDASEFATGAPVSRAPAFATFLKFGIGVVALLFIMVGVSVYADTANVPATSPLYPLKRLGENVQLAVAPASEKPQLQATFAVRRANEIAALQVSAPTSTLIPELTSDLDQDISGSLGAAVAVNNSNSGQSHVRMDAASSATATTSLSAETSSASIAVYCNAFDVSTSGVLIGHLESDLVLHAGALAEFNEQCADKNNKDASEVEAAAAGTSSVQATSTDQSDHYGRGGHIFSGGGNNSTSPPASPVQGSGGRGFPTGYGGPVTVTSTVNVQGSLRL